MKAQTITGSLSRTLVLLGSLGSVVFLTWTGDVNGDAAVGIISAIVGGVIHASGTKQGSEASTSPPPE